MGWWATILVTVLVLVVAGASAAGGFWVAVSGRGKVSRSRGPFLVGVVCGFGAGLILTGRRHGPRAAVAALARAIPAVASLVRRKPVAAWSWTGLR